MYGKDTFELIGTLADMGNICWHTVKRTRGQPQIYFCCVWLEMPSDALNNKRFALELNLATMKSSGTACLNKISWIVVGSNVGTLTPLVNL